LDVIPRTHVAVLRLQVSTAIATRSLNSNSWASLPGNNSQYACYWVSSGVGSLSEDVSLVVRCSNRRQSSRLDYIRYVNLLLITSQSKLNTMHAVNYSFRSPGHWASRWIS